jgi:hypothetical protein
MTKGPKDLQGVTRAVSGEGRAAFANNFIHKLDPLACSICVAYAERAPQKRIGIAGNADLDELPRCDVACDKGRMQANAEAAGRNLLLA